MTHFDADAYLAELDGRPTTAVGGGKTVYEDDARRIADLPWVDMSTPEIVNVAMVWATQRWSRGPDAPMQFREIQALALLVAHLTHGAFLPIGTGHGKTVIAMLAADAVGARKPLLFIPPTMRVPYDNARREYAKSFKLPGNLRVMAYSQLSVASSTDILNKLLPDVIVCDEAHNLKYLETARTKRVVRYMKANPGTRCIFMSGTLTARSVRDYAHLAEWALKGGSPVPLTKHFPVLQAFCNVLDARPARTNGGEAGGSDFAMMSPLFPDWKDYALAEPGSEHNPRVERARAVFQDRLVHTKGVVATSTASVGASLLMIERSIDVPDAVRQHLADLEATWRRPDGEEIVLALEKWRCGRQITQGFYYRWKWPDDEPDVEWLRYRAAWRREVSAVLNKNIAHLDSNALVQSAAMHEIGYEAYESKERKRLLDITKAARAAVEGTPNSVSKNSTLLDALRDWLPHSTKRWGRGRTPPTETVWIDDYLVNDAVAWSVEHPTGLLWYGDNAMGDALGERGIKVFGRETNPEDIAGRYGAALAIRCHKDGKNLQKHSENLVLNFVPSGDWMEQLISRTHRSGQEEDEVSVHWYGHTAPALNAVAEARHAARYIQETLRSPQRLCYATWISAGGGLTDRQP